MESCAAPFRCQVLGPKWVMFTMFCVRGGQPTSQPLLVPSLQCPGRHCQIVQIVTSVLAVVDTKVIHLIWKVVISHDYTSPISGHGFSSLPKWAQTGEGELRGGQPTGGGVATLQAGTSCDWGQRPSCQTVSISALHYLNSKGLISDYQVPHLLITWTSTSSGNCTGVDARPLQPF